MKIRYLSQQDAERLIANDNVAMLLGDRFI